MYKTHRSQLGCSLEDIDGICTIMTFSFYPTGSCRVPLVKSCPIELEVALGEHSFPIQRAELTS